MTGKEVRAMQDNEIKLEIERSRARLYQLRTQTVTEKVENTSEFRQVRRDIARLLTERQARHWKKMGGRPGAKAPAAAETKAAPAAVAGRKSGTAKKVTTRAGKRATKAAKAS